MSPYVYDPAACGIVTVPAIGLAGIAFCPAAKPATGLVCAAAIPIIAADAPNMAAPAIRSLRIKFLLISPAEPAVASRPRPVSPRWLSRAASRCVKESIGGGRQT